MINYITLIGLQLMFIMLCACTSQSIYKPATGSGFGYSEKILGENRYQVQFKAMNKRRADEYVLLRAATLTDAQGYDWFLVENRETHTQENQTEENEHFTNVPVNSGDPFIFNRHCGLLTCDNSVTPVVQNNVNRNDDNTTTVIIDIRFGKGVRPDNHGNQTSENSTKKAARKILETYDARDILNTIKPSP